MTETAQPQAAPQATTPLAEPAIGRTEFIALMAMMIATVAFSIDAMLPALPEITAELSADNPNRTQLLITSFVLGMGAGTLFVGPISDAFGRKPAVVGGAALYCFASLLAWAAPNLELVIAARVLQGLAASAARVVPMAIT
ncbi:MFS transporter, partial [Roseovarius sp.]